MLTKIIIASAISSNQNALFVPCDHVIYAHNARGLLSNIYTAPGPLVNEDTNKWLQLSRFTMCYMFMMLPSQFTLPQACSVIAQL